MLIVKHTLDLYYMKMKSSKIYVFKNILQKKTFYLPTYRRISEFVTGNTKYITAGLTDIFLYSGRFP